MGDRLTKEQLDHIERLTQTTNRSVIMPTAQLAQLVREHRDLTAEAAALRDKVPKEFWLEGA